MYQEHPVFTPPENENVAIWRYMDFAKLVSMLNSESLHFTRVDQFEDKFEGSLPKLYVETLSKSREKYIAEHPDERPRIERAGSLTRTFQNARVTSAVNCWHANEHESVAMWSQYLKGGEGIAVRSTFKRLIDSFGDDEDFYVFAGMVKYIDYEKDEFSAYNNVCLPILYKRASFRHEQELRVVAMQTFKYEGKIAVTGGNVPQHGFGVPVDLHNLVESIYVSPSSPGWFSDAVRSVVELFGLEAPIVQSSLNDEPLW